MSLVRVCGVLSLLLLFLGNTATPAEEPARTDLYGDPLPPGAVMRLGSVRLRHVGVGDTFSFSADGKIIRSLGRDRVIRHWDAASGREIRRIVLAEVIGESAGVPARRAWGGDTVAMTKGRRLDLWDASTGRHRRTFELKDNDMDLLVLSADGRSLAVGEYTRSGSNLRIWDVGGGAEHPRIVQTASVLDMKFSPNGKRFGTAGGDGVFHLWDTATGKEILKFPGPQQHLAFSPDGERIAASKWQTVSVWRVSDGKEMATCKEVSSDKVACVAFSPDGQSVAVGTIGETMLFDAAGGKPPRRLASARGWISFAPDGRTLASWLGGAIRQWDVATRREIAPRPGHDGAVGTLTVTADGRGLGSTSSIDPVMPLWDLTSGEQKTTFRAEGFHRSNLGALTPDGKQFVSGSLEGRLRLWNAASGREVRQFPIALRNNEVRENAYPVRLAIPPQDRQVAAVSQVWRTASSGKSEYQLDVWNRDTGASLVRRTLPVEGWAVCFAPDVRTMTYRCQDSIVLASVASGTEYVRLPGKLNWPFVLSPDGQILAATVYKKVQSPEDAEAIVLMELASGRRLLRIDTTGVGVNRLEISPDGRSLVVTTAEGFRVWDIATGEELLRRTLAEKHPSAGYSFATSLAFVGGSDRLATGLLDGTILIWDLGPKSRRLERPAEALDLERLWADLAAEDATRAHRAVGTLAAAPAKAVPFLQSHLRPAATLDATRVQRLIGDLDSAQFEIRDRAAKELAALGEQIEPELRKGLQGKPSLEVRRRLEELLGEAALASHGVARSPEILRTLRSIRALEAMGTSEARHGLEALAGGDPAARATRNAKEALRRVPSSVERRSGAEK